MHKRTRPDGPRPALAAVVIAVTILLGVPAPASARGQCGDPVSRPWCNTHLSADARAHLLLNAMTTAERIALLAGDNASGVIGGPRAHTGTGDGIPALGVPTINYTDGPLGPRQGAITGMPSPMADAATWNPIDNRAYGQVVGTEARDKGNDVVFGPTVNLVRTPLGGRTFEAFGEDPTLVADTAVAWIKGLQGTGEMADIKHFAENNQEGASACCANKLTPANWPAFAAVSQPDLRGSRMKVNVHVDERTLREMELAPFEAAVKQAHVATIMCSYNLIGGAHGCENDHLLTRILGQWKFPGYVLADYGAAHDTGPSLRSGLDFEPWPPNDVYGPTAVSAALHAGQASQSDVDRHVLHMLRTWFTSGVFDRQPYIQNDALIRQAADASVSQRIEEHAITLLRNRHGLLPLNAHQLKSIAVIGAGASTYVTGGGSGSVTAFHFATPVSAITARVGRGARVLVSDGSDVNRAAQLARQAQVAVVLTPDFTSEGVDRACLTLECPPAFGNEDNLIRAVAAANPRTIVVLETSGPILTPWRTQIAGLLEAWYPGQEAGPAIARVLFGDADPAGRLPVTFPASFAQEPTAGSASKYPGVNDQETYSEGVSLGYRWFQAHRETPAYPFGFGLSYTTWKLSGWSLRGRRVSVRVRNTGRRTGSTVVQLYAGLPSLRGVPQPPKDLRHYQSVTLGPGRAATVRFVLSDRDLAYWNTQAGDWRVAPGHYAVDLGFSSADASHVGSVTQRRAITIAP